MSNETPILKAGALAYFDSFAGPVPCKITAIVSDRPGDLRPGTHQTVKAICTAKRGAYNKGEALTGAGLHFYPRKAQRVRSGQFRIGHYRVEDDSYTGETGPAQLKTGVLYAYTPQGTTSAVTVELQYRDRIKHRITGPDADRERLIHQMREWARKNGYTHTRRFGQTGLAPL